jgi:ankyrin repeat protein
MTTDYFTPIVCDNNTSCNIHNDEYVGICAFERLYCKKCSHVCDKSHPVYTIGYWKKQTLIEIQKFEDKLNNKIRVLNHILELVQEYKEIIKQIEDASDTTYVNISHINDFNKIINDDDNLPISHIIKRKNTILNNNPIISIDNIDKLDKHLIEFIDIIIKNNGDIHANNESALIWASMYGHISVVECLIKYGAAEGWSHLGDADIHAKDDLAICVASENGHLNIVKCLISHGANINTRNDYSFRYASGCGHLDIVECLISHGIDINARDGHAISYASEYGYLDVVELLIKNGADVHADNEYALQCASKNGHLAVVEYLMKHGADIGKAIKWASYGGHLDVVEYLTKYN